MPVVLSKTKEEEQGFNLSKKILCRLAMSVTRSTTLVWPEPTTSKWIAIQFCTDIRSCQSINLTLTP